METLTEEDRDRITSYLSNPMLFPQEFKTWLTDWLSVNIPDIPVSQIMGYQGTLANSQVLNVAEEGAGLDRTWQDLATVGPEITGLADGNYFAIFGAYVYRYNAAGGTQGQVGPSVNNADPTVYASGGSVTDTRWTFRWRAAPISVKGLDNNNSVRLKYWWDNGGGSTAGFDNRYLTILRIT